MTRLKQIAHEFVTFVPKVVSPGVVYVSMEYATVIHMCCCGCGNKVITPLAPGRWHLTFDGESISLAPSIGNWSFPCQSHYWVHQNQIVWAGAFNAAQISAVRAADLRAMQRSPAPEFKKPQAPWWHRVLRWLKLSP